MSLEQIIRPFQDGRVSPPSSIFRLGRLACHLSFCDSVAAGPARFLVGPLASPRHAT
jgi:hypothetical protein